MKILDTILEAWIVLLCLAPLVLLLSCGGDRVHPRDNLEKGCRVGCHPHESEVLWPTSKPEDSQCWCLPAEAPAYRFVPGKARSTSVK